MVAHGYGRVVNVASIAGKEGNPMAAAYSASKAAVIGMTKSIAKEVAGIGVLVNCIAPAVIDTPILSQLSDEHIGYTLEKIPLGRPRRSSYRPRSCSSRRSFRPRRGPRALRTNAAAMLESTRAGSRPATCIRSFDTLQASGGSVQADQLHDAGLRP
jgi:NAD(P)-dependent dehydrogenase (short-subunit alcohol dehydrogenase family)